MVELPKYVYQETTRHGKKVLYFRRANGNRVRMPNDTNSYDFIQLYQRLLSGNGGTTTRGIGIMRANYIRDIMAQKVKAAIQRDQKLGRKSTITFEWVMRQIAAQDHACAITRIPFQYQGKLNERVSPFSPSIDRIDNRKGYEKENVKIVISALNLMRLDWGDTVFDIVAEAYIANKRPRTLDLVRAVRGEKPNKISKQKRTKSEGGDPGWSKTIEPFLAFTPPHRL